MYNNPYVNVYNPQTTAERIDTQIAELQKMKSQLPQNQPAINQTFQLAPNNTSIRFVDSIQDVEKDLVIGDTPFFSKDMSVMWVKNIKGEIKSYEIKEIIQKDEKDLQIELLQAQLEELKKVSVKNESGNGNDDESVEIKKSSNVSKNRTAKKY